MKHLKRFFLIVIIAMTFSACGSSKNVPDSRIYKGTSLEGEKVTIEDTKMQGYDMVEDLSEDGSQIVKVAYKWFAGIGKADDKQAAIEMAELEARATISRTLNTLVKQNAERGQLIDNGVTQKALTSHWEQVSHSIQNACQPFGNTKIEYSPTTKMYTVTAKIGIRGDKYKQMINNASNYKPNNLSGKELEDFIEVNKSIMNAAKGN